MAHYPCPDCCGPVECTIAADDFGDGSLAAYTQLVGTWTEAAGVVSPDTTTANQRLQWDAATLTDPYAHVIRSRFRGGAGDQLGIGIYRDANNYALALVTFGTGTSGRLEFRVVNSGSTLLVHTADQECRANEYDIPPDEWVTLALRFQNSLCIDSIVNVVLEVEDTSDTHTLGVSVPLFDMFKAIQATGPAPSSSAEFDDLAIEIGSPQPGGACEEIIHCCVTDQAAALGHGSAGWDIVTGSWTDDPGNDRTSVTSVTAKRLIEYVWLNDNLQGNVDLGPVVLVTDDTGDLLDETVWRYFFSVNGTDDWWIEVRLTPLAGGTIGSFTYRPYQFFISLENEGVIKAWIYGTHAWTGATIGFVGGPLPLQVIVHDCAVVFGVDHGQSAIYWSTTGGAEAEGSAGFVTGFRLCVDGLDLNRTGKVGIGTGLAVDEAGFSELAVSCSAPVDCNEYPAADEPTPDDPGDPTGCCAGYDSLQTGDPIELTLGSWTYWFGEGCADMNCSVGSDFLAEFNATHTLTVVEKNALRIRAVGNLPDNECDECAGIHIKDGVELRLHNRAELVIESVSDTQCIAKLWIRGRCAECVWYFEATLDKGVDCSVLGWALISGNSNPGGHMCCLHAGDVGIDLP